LPPSACTVPNSEMHRGMRSEAGMANHSPHRRCGLWPASALWLRGRAGAPLRRETREQRAGGDEVGCCAGAEADDKERTRPINQPRRLSNRALQSAPSVHKAQGHAAEVEPRPACAGGSEVFRHSAEALVLVLAVAMLQSTRLRVRGACESPAA
jgi:hypothetical protein